MATGISGSARSDGVVRAVTAAGSTEEQTTAAAAAVPRWLLVALGLCAPFLLYVPGQSLPPLVTILALVVIIRSIRVPLQIPFAAVVALALAAMSAVVLTYSSNAHEGLDAVLYYGELGGLLYVGYRLGFNSRGVIALTAAWAAAATIDAVMVIYFRLQPNAEISWFRTSIARLFIPSGTLDTLFTTAPNNALDPDKAGAFFVNANEGGAFLGVAFVASLYVFRTSRQPVWLLVAALDAVAIVASGSKTDLALLGLIALALIVMRIRAIALRVVLLPPLVLVAAVAAVAVVTGDPSDFISRGTLWGTAVQAIAAHPVFGLGYGGWDVYAQGIFVLIGTSATYPPHNVFLFTWIQIGALGAVCLAVFFGSVLHRVLRSGYAGRGLVTAAVCWTLLHSMGDNTGIFNDLHTMPMLAVLVGSYLSRGEHGKARARVPPRSFQAIRALHPPAGRSPQLASDVHRPPPGR